MVELIERAGKNVQNLLETYIFIYLFTFLTRSGSLPRLTVAKFETAFVHFCRPRTCHKSGSRRGLIKTAGSRGSFRARSQLLRPLEARAQPTGLTPLKMPSCGSQC